MHRRRGLTLAEAVVLVAVVAVGLLALLAAQGCQRRELTNRTICMSNLSSIGKALTLYKGTNDNLWPWVSDKLKTWDTTPTGTNRDKDPFKDPNDPGDRAITSLMFLLVRENQPAKMFICPSTSDRKDQNILDEAGASGGRVPEYFWDFSSAANVSYSWQAPIKGEAGPFGQGLNDNDNGTVVIADRTPAAGDPTWRPDDVSLLKPGKAMERNMSRNHAGQQVNTLFVGMNVARSEQPLVPYGRGQFDNIYTASSAKKSGSASATSLDIAEHLSTRDTFLIGPVPGGANRPPRP